MYVLRNRLSNCENILKCAYFLLSEKWSLCGDELNFFSGWRDLHPLFPKRFITEASSFILQNKILPCDSLFYLQIQGNASEYIIPIGDHAKKVYVKYESFNQKNVLKRTVSS